MPANVVADMRKMWATEIRSPDGQPLLRNWPESPNCRFPPG